MRHRSTEQPVSDINITPLTDVMMVLLVIFMISSPILLARGMEVHLPAVENPPMLVEQDHVLYLTAEQDFILDGQSYTRDGLKQAFLGLVEEADKTGGTVNLFLRADESVSYGDITKIMSDATEAGIERISLVQEVLASEPTAEPVVEQPSETTGEIPEESPPQDGGEVANE